MNSSFFATTGKAIKILTALLALSCTAVNAHTAESGQVTELMKKLLPDIPGKQVTMITVDYAPGASDPVHRHNAHAFVYVLEGTIVMGMKGGKEVTLKPGETFYEDPEGIHLVGRNASATKPAKFLVFLITDKDAPIVVPVKDEGGKAKEK